MPVKVEKRGKKFCVVDPDGKLTGKCHSTKEAAVKQVQAINLSMRRREGKPAPAAPKGKGAELIAAERVRVLAVELDDNYGTALAEQAPITIMSDGTPEGTSLMIAGQPVAFDSMDIYCNRDSEYPSCSISVTMKDTDENGMEVRRTMTLRKEESPKGLS